MMHNRRETKCTASTKNSCNSKRKLKRSRMILSTNQDLSK
jgi:hypothetical protein